MRTKRRTALGTAAAAAIALAAGGAAAAPASADGPRTPDHVAVSVQEQPWVELEEGTTGYRVVAIGFFLNQTGHFDGEPELEFTAELTEAVEAYQSDRGLSATGDVDTPTWERLSDDIGLVRQGDPRSDLVTGLQWSLYDLGYDLSPDGRFGPATENAVTMFQKRKRIDADGIIGPLTFRAMYAYGAQEADNSEGGADHR
ncbi:peptidoglycan-binding domain-containing protein [Allosalinactinospora lopnorensis]|uniref:peptidoglycan-binding domain-containing protein n=1 Tax=Allosalinactinospora lopnorensis TaxID=1352348 RepID=UPI000698FB0A|nr:peptidoglycan-binding protein [Allosalinactinospora lopnorensis]